MEILELLTISLLALAIPCSTVPNGSATKDWEHLDKNLQWEYYFSNDEKNWYNARRECVKEGADLVDVTSEAEVLALQNKSRKLEFEFMFRWCGATDFNLDSAWTWSDGSQVNSSLLEYETVIGGSFNDLTNTPNKCAGVQLEHPRSDFATNETSSVSLSSNSISVSYKVMLFAVNCGTERKFICKRSESNFLKKTSLPKIWTWFVPKEPPVTVTQCPVNSIDLGTKCIRIEIRSATSKLNWEEAVEYCKKTYGPTSTLASLQSKTELLSITVRLGTTGHEYWVGGYNDAYFRWELRWTDNSPISDMFIRTRLAKDERDTSEANFGDFGFEMYEKYLSYESLTNTFAYDNRSAEKSFICQVGIKRSMSQLFPLLSLPRNRTTVLDNSTEGMPYPTTKPTTEHIPDCPEDFARLRDGCFKVFNQSETFDNAEEICKEHRGSHLTSVESRAQNAEIHLLALASGLHKMWLGLKLTNKNSGTLLRSLITDSIMLWVDGMPVVYSDFYLRDKLYHLRQNQTICFYQSEYGSWSVTSCEKRLGFICKYVNNNTMQNTEIVENPRNSYCQRGWTGLGNDCYFFSSYRLTWQEAVESCFKKHSTSQLLVVTSQLENFFVTLKAKIMSGASRVVWLGIYKPKNNDGSFTALGSSNVTYHNWLDRDELAMNKKHKCAALNVKYEGQWSWMNCEEMEHYVCKMPRQKIDNEQRYKYFCPEKGWINWSHFCYLFLPNACLSWDEAQSTCKGQNVSGYGRKPTMASIHSLAEETFVQKYLEKESLLPFHTKSWIGARNLADKWVWEDGTDFNYSKGLGSWDSPVYWNSYKKEYEYRRRGDSLCGAIEEHNQYWDSSYCGMAYGAVCKVAAVFNDTNPLKSTTSQRLLLGSFGYDDNNTDVTTVNLDRRTEKLSETTVKKVHNTSDIHFVPRRSQEKPGNSNINSVSSIVICLLTTTVIILLVLSLGFCCKKKLKSLSCCFRPLHSRRTTTKTELQILDHSSAL